MTIYKSEEEWFKKTIERMDSKLKDKNTTPKMEAPISHTQSNVVKSFWGDIDMIGRQRGPLYTNKKKPKTEKAPKPNPNFFKNIIG